MYNMTSTYMLKKLVFRNEYQPHFMLIQHGLFTKSYYYNQGEV